MQAIPHPNLISEKTGGKMIDLFEDLPPRKLNFRQELARFEEFGTKTVVGEICVNSFDGRSIQVPKYTNEFWTARQRACHSLHEISYRACFKPQLPRFFIERMTAPGDRVYDPFMGSGTTLIESALMGRFPVGCDVNPLSDLLTRPRFSPPDLDSVESRLKAIDGRLVDSPSGGSLEAVEPPEDLLVFYHPETLKQIGCLRQYLIDRQRQGALDDLDAWIRMVATNRLTGHSPGFFSVYTLPPNQAVSVKAQVRINLKRNQTPPIRNVADLILKKSKSLLSDWDPSSPPFCSEPLIVTGPSHATPQIASDSIDLIVTSPPFLNVVDYAADNWLRCWFCGIDASSVPVTMATKVPAWQQVMSEALQEFHRLVKPGGHVAFEVGEVFGVRLEEAVIPCGISAGFEALLVMINQQDFTKTANCWGVDNGKMGTNTNRIVLFRKK